MTTEQDREWAEAQKITVSIDLVEAAKNHLKFLAAVDRNRFLYEDRVLQRAIYRYNVFWLPLLAKHLENPISEGLLIVPLDCEWIWHCHRLNPARYKFDCEKLYGRILGNREVISTVQATSKTSTEDIWRKMYPEEPFELDLSRPFPGDVLQNRPHAEKFTKYDLLSAVKRQISFTYQVSRPHVSDDLFLQEAMARYKGFLYLVRSNMKTGLNINGVPTYDVDLMWHTHQLHPDSYCKDMNELVGFVLQHDDTDSDRSKGGKLYDGYTETTKQWEQTFGRSYWKAGATYRGNSPTPVTQVPFEFHVEDHGFYASNKIGQGIQLTTTKAVEVLLEFADIKNLPEEYKENLVVNFSKNQNRPDILFNTKASLGISSNSKEKQVAIFRCEPNGEFFFELVSSAVASNEKRQKLLGSCSLCLEELLADRSQLSTNKWVSVDLASDLGNIKPLLLHVSLSFTPPTESPQVFQLVRSQSLGNDMIESLVVDSYGNEVFRLQKRNIVKQGTKCTNDLLEVYCINESGEKHALVEFDGDCWSVKGTHGSFKLQKCNGKDGSLFELVGYKTVKLFAGRKLDFELEHLKNEKSDHDFWTAVEFNTEYPYGRATALIDSKSGNIKAIDDWIFVPSIALTFMLSDLTKECGHIEKINPDRDTVKGGVDGGKCLANCVHQVKSAEGSKCHPLCRWSTVKTASVATCLYDCSTGCTPVTSVDADATWDMFKTADGTDSTANTANCLDEVSAVVNMGNSMNGSLCALCTVTCLHEVSTVVNMANSMNGSLCALCTVTCLHEVSTVVNMANSMNGSLCALCTVTCQWVRTIGDTNNTRNEALCSVPNWENVVSDVRA